jgi:FHS family L-fucose permease-like MFS transporter
MQTTYAPLPHASSDRKPSIFPSGSLRAFTLVTGLFFLWGMSNNLTDILVQQFRKSFELSSVQAQLVQTAVFLGYFLMAVPAALLMERKGYKFGILVGLLLFGCGTLCFWPAAVIGKYLPFLIALFLVGCGSAVLETASNPYIAQAGPAETANRRLNFSQSFNPPGTIAGVLLGTYFIFSGVELSAGQLAAMKSQGTYLAYVHREIMRVVPVYVGLGCVVLLFALLIARTTFPPLIETQQLDTAGETEAGHLRHASLWLAVVAQFFYCGAQVSTWSALIPYLKQYTGMPERSTGYFLMGNLVAFSIGRFIATALMKWVRPMSLVGIYAVVNIAMVCVAAMRPGTPGGICLLITSFFMAPMFPTIFASGVQGLGKATKLGGSIIVMAVVGAAVVPPALGYVARQYQSYAAGYLVTAVCYVIVAVYAALSFRSKATPSPVDNLVQENL